jgi:hypothetical protein
MIKAKSAKILARECVICASPLKITLQQNRRYRGGHYFGKIPQYSDAQLKEMSKTSKTKTIAGEKIQVSTVDLKPISTFEYWECNKCYSK